MSQKDLILDCFRRHGNKVTLGELLEDGRYSYAHKLTARLSDMRKEGYDIKCTEGDVPSNNLYTLVEPIPTPKGFHAVPQLLPGMEPTLAERI